jgi:quinol monooxygenase YgiN
MAATVHVIARWVAKAGKEDELKGILTALIPPSRREIGCYQYDLLRNPGDPRDFCFVERWEDDKAFEQHAATPHVRAAMSQAQSLAEGSPDVRRYHIL